MELETVHEDDRVRVRRITLAESEQSHVHVHEVDELSVTISGSSLQERDPDGFLLADILTEPGHVRLIPKGAGPHVLVNSGVGPYVAITVEAKVASPAHRPARPKKAKA